MEKPRVVIEWRPAGSSPGFFCTACHKAVRGGTKAAYAHRYRHHSEARAILVGVPGRELQHHLPEDRPRRKHKRIELVTCANEKQRQQSMIGAPGILPPSTPYHRSAHIPTLSKSDAALISTTVVSRVPGLGARRVSGLKCAADGADVAVSLVGSRLCDIKQRFGIAVPSSTSSIADGVDDLLEGASWDIDVVFGNALTRSEGPSASLGVAVALSALILCRDVHPDVLMTGALDLRGNVLDVGGVLLKIGAGMKSGMRKVLVPRSNFVQLDLADPNAMDEQLRAYIVASVEPVDTLFAAIPHAVAGCEAGPAAEGAGARVPIGYASLPSVVDHGRVQVWGAEACVVRGAKGQMWVTGGNGLETGGAPRLRQATAWAADVVETMSREMELESPVLNLRQLLATDGLHVNILSTPGDLQTWEVVGASLGLALVSLALGGRPLRGGHAVLGDLRVDGMLLGSVQGVSKATLSAAASAGWRRIVVPAKEAPRLSDQGTSMNKEGLEVEGIRSLSPAVVKRLFFSANGDGEE